jgi:hypothetical protein
MVTRRRFLKSSVLLSSLFFSGPGRALQPGEPSATARGAAARYFGDRADGFRLYGSGRMMAAQV